MFAGGCYPDSECHQMCRITKLVSFFSPGLPRSHPESYHSYMWNNFFKHIDIDPANAHILDGNAEDLEAECLLYEQKIAEAGGIELFVGGHMAFTSHSMHFIRKNDISIV